jgi:hypothetical protein
LQIEKKRVENGLKPVAEHGVQQLGERALESDPPLIVEAGGVAFLRDGDNLRQTPPGRCASLIVSSDTAVSV